MHTEITKCRICGDRELIPLLRLGVQILTGVFPSHAGSTATRTDSSSPRGSYSIMNRATASRSLLPGRVLVLDWKQYV